jgi:HK97 gp10 family phage protein
MEQAANETVAMMKSLVPTDTGTLKESINWTWGAAPKGALTLGKVKSRGNDLTITIYAGGPDAFHARWVEFGTSKMAKQPYFYVSWRANRKRAKRAIGREVRKTAKQVAAG